MMKNRHTTAVIIVLVLLAAGPVKERLPGWHENKSGSYYVFSFGKKLTGLKAINGVVFCFGEDGYQKTGLVEYEGDTYYFYPEGSYAIGEIELDSGKYVFDENGHLLHGFVNKGGKKYFYDDHGYLVSGEFVYEGESYLAQEDGQILSGIYQDENGDYRGNDEHGYPLYGIVDLYGRTYIFSDEGIMYRNGFYQGYYIDENGVAGKAERLDISDYHLTSNGTYLTDPEVDEMADEILASIITPGMSEVEQLRAVYLWTKKNVRYTAIHIKVGDGFDDKVADLAKYALNYRKGACYHFASLNLYLLNRLGFQALIAEGQCTTVRGGWTTHYWNMVVYEGQWYHFDPMLEQAYAPYDIFLKCDKAIYNRSSKWKKGDLPESGEESVEWR